MAMTLEQYRTLVLRQLDEYIGGSNAMFTDADIDAEVNAAQSEVVRATNHDYFKASITVDATAALIDLPEDFLGVADMVLITDSSSTSGRRRLLFRTAQVMDETMPNWRAQTTTYPQFGVMDYNVDDGFGILLSPAPIATITDGFFMRYLRRPTNMVADDDTSTCELFTFFPEFERNLIPWKAVSLLLQNEAGEMDDRVLRLESMWENRIVKFRQALNMQFNTFSQYGSYGSTYGG